MVNDFERFSGEKYDFLPPEIASKIRQAGTRIVVFVEGDTDARIFGQILFKASVGWVEALAAPT